jgi:CRISPR-associated protein Csh2
MKKEKKMPEVKRTEILFLYDVQNANPNGDPSDENKPRIDEETGINIVTDVRLKRTVRDYFQNFLGYDGKNGKDIFVRQTNVGDDPEKGLNDAKGRAKSFDNNPDNIFNQCIDIRLFGGVIPITTGKSKDSSITLTGPVQFKIGHSLHKVKTLYIKGTGAFASKAGAEQNTFREEYILPYSLIAFYGIFNENAAKHSKMTTEDLELLKEALWNGTKQLITRSKFEHNPRMLLTITHDDPNCFIGELDHYIELNSKVNDEEIRNLADFELDLSKLNEKFNSLKLIGKKFAIEIKADPNLKLKNWNQ